METRALTFSEMVALPGMLGRIVPVAIANAGEYKTASVRYVSWFDMAMAQVKKSPARLDAQEELFRLLDAAE